MLTQKQIIEIREHLERAQNPVFFFDNDCDGLMSFVMLRRFIDRGKGIAVKSNLEESYFKRVEEFNSDYIFILDKPVVSEDFIKRVSEKNIPVVWIDHHDVEVDVVSRLVSYYNSAYVGNKMGEPTSYLTYKIIDNKKEDWLAMIGCIADNFVPDFSEDFAKKYNELWKKSKDAFEILYESDFGKIIILLDFALKDRTTNVVAMFGFLLKVKSPVEILKESSENAKIHQRYRQINSVYLRILERAKKTARNSKGLVYFEYGGELSLSSNLANELSYRFPGKVVIVAYVKGASANVSVRGQVNVREIGLGILSGIDGATGGGHKHAIGAKMGAGDLKRLRDRFERAIG